MLLLNRSGRVVSASCSGIQFGVEGGFKFGVGEEGPGFGDEAGSFCDGDRAGAVGLGSVEEEGEAAVVGVDSVPVAGSRGGRVEPKNSVGIGQAVGDSAALGG